MSGVDPNLRGEIRAQIEAIEPDGNGCRLWPRTFAGGYAYVRVDGKPEYAHKLVIEPPDDFKVVRTCERKACLELSHLMVVPPRSWIRPRLDAKTDFDGPIPAHRPELGRCWVWTGRKIWNGYGLVYWNGEQWLVHRVSYTLDVGHIPDGLTIDHLCRNRACRRPAHLEPTTNTENVRRGAEFRREHAS
jgi:hypothetical protein